MKKKVKSIVSLLLVVSIIFGTLAIYFNSFYHADETALKALESTVSIEVKENDDYYSFKPFINPTSTAIVLYPGGKVEAKAYAPLCKELASVGYYVAIVKEPLNIALCGVNKASKVIEDTNYVNYYVGGHSLGGTTASIYAATNKDKIKGVILLASFLSMDISDTDLEVLSIYGSEDEILNKRSYEIHKRNLPKSFFEHIIDGGNHSQFGSYGKQKRDGNPSVSNTSFTLQCVSAIVAFTNKSES